MKNLVIILFSIFLLQTCKKSNSKRDFTKLTNEKNGNTTKTIYKEGKLITTEIFDKSGHLNSKYMYSNGVLVKIYQYYSNKKVNSYSYLHKSPNHYITKVYYKNGKVSNEGEGDFFKNKALFLRTGPWIFYSKTGEPFSVYTFTHDGKNQYIKGEMLFDTIKKKIIKDVIYNPPFLAEKK